MIYPEWLAQDPAERPTYVIAEIGQNHNGDLDLAIDLIEAAADAGAQAVKFQKRTLPDCVPEEQRETIRQVPGLGRVTYLEYREMLELSWSQLGELWGRARDVGLDCFVSVWDEQAALELKDGPWTTVKIPSAKITDYALLRTVRNTGLPTIISTGMSSEFEVRSAVSQLDDPTILHCHSGYPAPSHELNLRYIETLRRRFPGATIGYSGHEWGITTTGWAVVLGAEVVERHLTLRRGMWGSDHYSSLEPDIFRKLVRHIRSVPNALGTGEKVVWESEMEKRRSLRGT